MRLTDLLAGLMLAKAVHPHPDQGSLFAAPVRPVTKPTAKPAQSFEARRGHLHQEKRVTSQGRNTTVWVRNAAPAHPEDKRIGLFDAPQPAVPKQAGLFELAQGLAQQTRRPAAAHAPKPAAEAKPGGSLFSFDYSAEKPTLTMPSAPVAEVQPDPEPIEAQAPPPAPEAPTPLAAPAPTLDPLHRNFQAGGMSVLLRRNKERHGLEVMFGKKPDPAVTGHLKTAGFRWSKRQGLWYAQAGPRAELAMLRLQAVMEDQQAGTPAPPEGPVDFKALAAETRAKMNARLNPDGATPAAVPAPATPALPDKPRVMADGSQGMTQSEYRAQESGVLHVGSEKVEDGTTYRLNDHHRWQRVDAPEQPETATPTPEPVPAPTPATAEVAPAPILPPERLITRSGRIIGLDALPDGRLGMQGVADAKLEPVPGRPGVFKVPGNSTHFQARGRTLTYLSDEGLPDVGTEPHDPEGYHARLIEQLKADPSMTVLAATHSQAAAHSPMMDHALGLMSGLPGDESGKRYSSAVLPAALKEVYAHHRKIAEASAGPVREQGLKTLAERARGDTELKQVVAEASADHARRTVLSKLTTWILDLPAGQRGAIRMDPQALTQLAGLVLDDLTPDPDAPAVRPRLDYSKGFKAVYPKIPKYAFDLLARTTRATRKRANDDALSLAHTLEQAGRPATDAERETLMKWSGQGGVDGDRNAYYTPTKMAAAMWGLLHTHGFTGGRVLEPSIGGGVFAETAPASAQLTGVEINGDTASVTRLLHPDVNLQHMPMETYNTTSGDELFDAVIGNPPYGGRGNIGVATTRDLDKPELSTYEDYFIETSLDRVKPGGLVAVLVNNGVMQNAATRGLRARMLARADVVTVVRAPLSTFEDSGAAVTPDIILLRKRPDGVGEAIAALVARHGEDALKAAGVHREDVLDGNYIATTRYDDSGLVVGYGEGYHPEHALGDIGGHLRRNRGYQVAVRGELDEDSLNKLASMPADEAPAGPADPEELAQRLHAAGASEVDIDSAATIARLDHYPIPEGAISSDGELIFKNHRWHKVTDNDLTQVRGAIQLARTLQTLSAQTARGAYHSAEVTRQDALEQASAYLAAHGDPGQDEDVRRALVRLPFLNLALAALTGGQLSDVLTQPVQGANLPADVDTTDPGSVSAALASQGRLNPETLAEIHGVSEAEALNFLCASPGYAWNGHLWQRAEDYYWGDALVQAEAAEAFARSEDKPQLKAKLLSQAAQFRGMVDRKAIHEIDFSPRDKFVPLDAVEHWLNEYLDSYRSEGQRNPVTGEYEVTKTPLLHLTYKDGVYSAGPAGKTDKGYDYQYEQAIKGLKNDDVQTVLDYLNRRTRVKMVQDRDKNKSAAQKEKERADNVRAARDYESGLKDNFRSWVFANDFGPTIEDEYNRQVGGYVSPPNILEPFPLEDWNLSRYTPHPFQYATVRKAVAQGSSYIALDVGLGKTGVGLMIAAKLKQEGRAKKPTITVPPGVLGDWANEIEAIMPGKKALVIGISKGKDGKWREDSAATKQAKLARLAAESWDLVLMSHELFEDIPMRREAREQLIMGDFERQRLESLKGQQKFSKKDGDLTAAALVNMSNFVSANISKVKVARESDLCFEDLGIDALVTDEAHNYKNLFAAPKEFGETVKFLGGGAESNRAMEFQHKTKHIREANGDGSGIFCMSATPTKNSPLEIYYALQFVCDDLAKRGIPSSEDFMDRYCVKDTVIVPGKDGALKPFQGVVGFKNLDELRGIMDRYLVRETARTALVKDKAGAIVQGLPMPDREDRQVFFDMSEAAQDAFHGLKAEAHNANRESAGASHLFSIYDRMRKLSLDPGLYDPSLAEGPNPRFVKAAELSHAALQGGGKVVMFMDNGQGHVDGDDEDGEETPKKRKSGGQGAIAGTSYERLVNHLVKQGVPREQIAVVTGQTTDKTERTRIAADFRTGKYRVVIGNKVMEEGMNLQTGTTDMIHLTTPWDPGSYWQRLGRAQRQGNTTAVVKNHVLLAKGSFDQFTYSALLGKKGWSDSLWDPSIKDGQNGDAANVMDELQLQFAENREDEQARLDEERGKVRMAQHQQMVKSTGALLSTYQQTLDARDRRARESRQRKKGPTPTDHAALSRLDATAAKLRTTIEATPDYPYKAMLTHRGSSFLHPATGVPYHEGMTFGLPIKGAEGLTRFTVSSVKTDTKQVFAHDEHGHGLWLNTDALLPAQEHAVAEDVQGVYSGQQMAKADTLSAMFRRMQHAR